MIRRIPSPFSCCFWPDIYGHCHRKAETAERGEQQDSLPHRNPPGKQPEAQTVQNERRRVETGGCAGGKAAESVHSVLSCQERRSGGRASSVPQKRMDPEELKRCVTPRKRAWPSGQRQTAAGRGPALIRCQTPWPCICPFRMKSRFTPSWGFFWRREACRRIEYSLLTAMLNETGVKLKDFFIQS